MSAFRLLSALGVVAAILCVALAITTTALDGWEFVVLPALAWLGFAAVMGLGTFVGMVIHLLSLASLFWMRNHTQEKLFNYSRWLALVLGLALMLYAGVPAIVDGIRNNRMVSAELHYKRCLAKGHDKEYCQKNSLKRSWLD